MKIAILGLPQAGKRTLFALLTGRDASVRSPDEAVEGVADIRDPRVDAMSAMCRPERTKYATNVYVLCPDAPPGGGADRAWLDAARRCDLLCVVLRAFEDGAVFHPAGSVDAGRDRQALGGELFLADMAAIETRLVRIDKEQRGRKTAERDYEAAVLRRCMAALEDGKPVRDVGLSAQEEGAVRSLGFLTMLPWLWVYNVSEDALAADRGPGALTISARIEREIMALESAAERAEYLASLGLASSGLDRMNAAAYDALGLMSFYTIGKDEVRAWTIRKGAAAPVAGGKIHTDIQRGFIRVEVIKYDDLAAAGSEEEVRRRGHVQLKGRDYVMQDGDVCHFLFNV